MQAMHKKPSELVGANSITLLISNFQYKSRAYVNDGHMPCLHVSQTICQAGSLANSS